MIQIHPLSIQQVETHTAHPNEQLAAIHGDLLSVLSRNVFWHDWYHSSDWLAISQMRELSDALTITVTYDSRIAKHFSVRFSSLRSCGVWQLPKP